jgi:photosystem II stability/assembly factor-like uncharacterized protein
MRAAVRAFLILCLPGVAWSQGSPSLTSQVSGTSKLLQAISVVSDRVVWVSGHGATYARTTDGGATWQASVMPGDTTLQFRDVNAFDENTAYLMTSGTGKASRIYFTTDGGKSWTLQHTNPDSAGFYDCFAFFDRQHALLTGDEVDGQAVVLTTSDGRSWTRVPPAKLPVPRKGEGSFAASGDCIVTVGERHAWIGTGAGLIARVFHTADRGQSWTAVETPIAHETSSGGISAVAFRDTLNGIAVGGDNAKAEIFSDNVAFTSDGGKTWTLGGKPSISGGLYGAVYLPGAATPTVVAVGPKGATYSTDGGKLWQPLDTKAYWSVGFASNGTGWLVGPGGRITKVVFSR